MNMVWHNHISLNLGIIMEIIPLTDIFLCDFTMWQ